MIGDDIAAALPALRAEAESLMVDRGTIERADGWDVDPDNGQRVPRWAAVATTPVRVVRVTVADLQSSTGGQSLTQAVVEFRAPWTLADLRIGDRIILTASADSRLLGVPIVVSEIDHATHAVARRFRGVLDEDRQLAAAEVEG